MYVTKKYIMFNAHIIFFDYELKMLRHMTQDEH